MAWWNNLFSAESDEDGVDYYREGVELLGVGKYHEALTSFRLALRDDPGDTAAMQQVAIAYTRIGMTDEAARTYQTVLQNDPDSPGAHYGLAFLMLREGQTERAVPHLRRFLESPPGGNRAEQHIDHARRVLEELTDEPAPDAAR